MKRFLAAVLFTFLCSLSATAQFQAGCNPLKGQLANPHLARMGAFTSCPNQGDGGAPSQAQNIAKNNFCAANSPVEVNISLLRSLEAVTEARLNQAHIPFGSPTNIPPDRNRLRQGFNVGNMTFREGMAVLIRAFVLDAHYSNLKKGESVNCKIGGKKNNDIHVALGATPSSDECFGVTAEISPHFRPETWADFDDWEFSHPIMFVGQLFYDASHKPCTQGHPVSPARIASWEIHPVYSIFVCKNATLQACPSNNPNVWWAFHEWVNLPDDEEEGHHVKKKRQSFWALKELLYGSETRL